VKSYECKSTVTLNEQTLKFRLEANFVAVRITQESEKLPILQADE